MRAQLEDTARDLLRSNEDLTRFAYAASHDLRSPLNSVQTFAEFLSKRFAEQLGPEGGEAIGFITEGVERMQRLITGLLHFARAGTEPNNAGTRTDAEKVLDGVLQDLKGETASVTAQITASPLPELGVQEVHLHQLMQNLLGNAIKYRGSAAPRVHVSARRNSDNWTFSVADNGTGIEPRHLEDIFQPFRRLHGGDVAGSGIGLATCRRIVSAYGGAIWAESTPGIGSTFFFTLPGASPQAARTAGASS